MTKTTVFALCAIVCALGAGAASAAEEDVIVGMGRQFTRAEVFTFLFLMLGPIKIIGPFAKVTAGADNSFVYKTAAFSTLFAGFALLFAGLVGEAVLLKYGISLPILALAAGLILFLVALRGILEQFQPPEVHYEKAPQPKSAMKLAMSQVAFPVIVTPYGIATLIFFLALSPTPEGRTMISVLVIAIMVLNFIVMVLARHLMPVMSIVLPILGAVLGVIQVALGLQFIDASLRELGFF